MNKILLTIIAFFSFTILSAQNPKWYKKIKDSQVTVITYTKNNDIKEAQGTFINDKGDVITEYDILKGAEKAIVVDHNGNEYKVATIAGANSIYNVAKLKTNIPAKTKIAFLASGIAEASKQECIYILPNAKSEKTAICTQDTIAKVDTFKNGYKYYSLANAINERLANNAVLNAKGELIGLLQMSAKENGYSFVIDAKFIDDLKISPLDAGNNDLKAIKIRKSLPDTPEDALSYIFLFGNKEQKQYIEYLQDFTDKYPDNTTGYILKAECLAECGQYAEADSVYNVILSIDNAKKDEVHFSKSKIIMNLNLSDDYIIYNDWNIEKALEEASKAYEDNQLPIYTKQEAECLFALKRYNEAADKFISVSKTNLHSAEIFLYAAQCKQAAKVSNDSIIALLDSALNCYRKPYPVSAANIILLRASTLADAGKNREAVAGFNDYEHLSNNNLTANFYYIREQLEVKCRMYPAALNDIEKAIKLSPNDAILYAEAAALNFRINQVDEAIEYSKKAIEQNKDFADPYRIIGVCYKQKNNKTEAKRYLLKAKELGDTMVDKILNELN